MRTKVSSDAEVDGSMHTGALLFARLAAVLGCTVSVHTLAQGAEPGARCHDGFYLRAALGMGGGTLDRKGSLDTGSGGVYGGNSSISGPMGVFELAAGGTPTTGLVVLGGVASYRLEEAKLDRDSGEEVDLGGVLEAGIVGAGVEYFPDERGGLHLGALLGLGFASAPTPSGSLFDQLGDAGGALSLSVGYGWWVSDSWSLVLLGRFVGGRLHGEATKQGVKGAEDDQLVLGSVAFDVQYHGPLSTAASHSPARGVACDGDGANDDTAVARPARTTRTVSCPSDPTRTSTAVLRRCDHGTERACGDA